MFLTMGSQGVKMNHVVLTTRMEQHVPKLRRAHGRAVGDGAVD